jgi:hypothetical protein
MDNFSIQNAEENGFEPEYEVGDAAPSVTPLLSLKDRRNQIVNELYVDLQVPRWESPEIYVRFKPVSATKLNTSIEYRRKSKTADWSFLANADVLVDSCIGIYAVMEGNVDEKLSLRPDDPQGSWTKFDSDLAKALGLDVNRAVDTCIGLYLTEGDLIETANKLFKWSGIANEEADETF